MKLFLMDYKCNKFFDCSGNDLVNLIGSPKEVASNFYGDRNQLTSLEGAPEYIGGTFFCDRNQLTSLEGAPRFVGNNFFCNKNKKRFTKEEVREVSEVVGEIHT